MVRLWSPSISSDEHQHPHLQQQQGEDQISFDDVDSCFVDHFPDFDPIEEWLVDPDHNLMPDVGIIADFSDGLECGNLELGHQDSFLPASIDEKMEKVSLADSQIDPNGDDGKTIQALEAKMEVDDDVPNVLAEEMKTCDGCINDVKIRCIDDVKINDVVSEGCLVTDHAKAADDTDGEESTEESKEESEDSSSESSSSSSSSREDESSSSDEEVDNTGGGGGEKVVTAEVEVEEGEINGGEKVVTAEVEVEHGEINGGEKVVTAEIEVEEGEINGEVEEGEINVDDLEEFILGSDGEEAVPKGPIKSKHEIEDLPPVPPLDVSLEPHHQTLPVGIVSSILGNRVIVEGSEKHSPLNEGSILWITETRSPLGIIDEIFGPVKNPYYVVRYNSDEEVPPGIGDGVAVSFVVEFANHILNEKCLYQKGYDASGNDDEEVTYEAEFSDDEKEAEYRRSLRQKKRNANSGNQESGFGKESAGFRDKQPALPHSMPARAVNRQQPSCNGTRRESANSGSSVAPSPSEMPAFHSQPRAFQMGAAGALGNTAQQLNAGSVQGFSPQAAHAMGIRGGFPHSPQFMAMQGGGPPLNWFSGQQVGDLICQLQNQAQVLNHFAGGMMPFQQQQQQYIGPYMGAIPGNFQWVDPSSALAGLMGQGGFNQVPFGCGNVNPMDPSAALAGLMGQGGFSQVLFGRGNVNPGLSNPSNGPSSAPAGLMGQGGFSQAPFGRGNVNPGFTNPSNGPSSAPAGLTGQGGFSQAPFGRVNANTGSTNPTSDPSGCGDGNPEGSSTSGNMQDRGPPQPAVNQGNWRPPPMHHNTGRFNRGRSSFRGRRQYQRGGHRPFGRGGSGQQNG